MKKSIVFLFVILVGSVTYAQQAELTIPGLLQTNVITKITLVSATRSDANTYIIEKIQDANSQKIEQAVQSISEFDTVFILQKSTNGTIITTKLSSVTLGNFKPLSENGNATERFTIHFEREDTMQ